MNPEGLKIAGIYQERQKSGRMMSRERCGALLALFVGLLNNYIKQYL